MKALLALVPLLSLGAAVPTFTAASVPGSPILKVECLEGSGSAFRVGPHLIASVDHVTSLGGCFIDGEPVEVSYRSGDFSLVTPVGTSREWLKVDCGGFIKGRKYRAEGYARGLDKIQDVDLEGTGDGAGQFSLLEGTFTVIPGMSGGPIVDDETGKVVGTVNTYNYPAGISGSIALRDTKLCSRA